MGFEGTRRSEEPDIDVAIIGAGLSGIGMAAHMQMLCPDRSYAPAARRHLGLVPLPRRPL